MDAPRPAADTTQLHAWTETVDDASTQPVDALGALEMDIVNVARFADLGDIATGVTLFGDNPCVAVPMLLVLQPPMQTQRQQMPRQRPVWSVRLCKWLCLRRAPGQTLG
ncbi:hypothetical protein AK812_SmicGene47663 [Symbiodinium microadriaticum]|uniref:Uncharacterized protein n=1 Tax=Symbiodinium microadriaticum TaxID=2951 RepID=A0A1Q9BR78_SYMMI|nr:hypothetical protein AK812_SmicGene47663 [Symbiodinium microadriaticum]